MIFGIVGYRYFTNYSLFQQHLQKIQKIYPLEKWTAIISGGASGVDTLAKKYANQNNIDFIEYPANWKKYGTPYAAYRRNQKIVDKSDVIIAFVHPKSRGTWDTINRAKQKSLKNEDTIVHIIKVS